MKKKPAAGLVQKGVFPFSLTKSVAYNKDCHELCQSWSYGLCSSSLPGSLLPGVWHRTSYFCFVKINFKFFLIFFPTLSLNFFPSLATLLAIVPSTHSRLQVWPVAPCLAPPPYLTPVKQREQFPSLQSSSGLQLTVVAGHSTSCTDSA